MTETEWRQQVALVLQKKADLSARFADEVSQDVERKDFKSPEEAAKRLMETTLHRYLNWG